MINILSDGDDKDMYDLKEEDIPGEFLIKLYYHLPFVEIEFIIIIFKFINTEN